MITRELLLRNSLKHTVADVHYNPTNSLALEWKFVGTCSDQFDLPEKPAQVDGVVHIYDITCGVWRDLMVDYVELHHTDWYDYVEFDETVVDIPLTYLANLPEDMEISPNRIVRSPAIDVFDWCSRDDITEYTRFDHERYFKHIKQLFKTKHKTENLELKDMIVFHEAGMYEDVIKELNITLSEYMLDGENTDATTEQLDFRQYHLSHGGEFTIYDKKLR